MPSATCHCGAVRSEIARRRVGVKARNFEPEAIGAVRTRRFGGASSWKFT